MKKNFIVGGVFALVYIIFYFIFRFTAPILAIFLNFIGNISVINFLPAKYCNIDIMVCRAPVGIISSIIISAIFYFLVGVLIATIFFRNKK